MNRWFRIWIASLSALAIVAFASPNARAECNSVSMTVTAELSSDPGFEGLYKYTVTGSWDVVSQGLSHIDFFLALENLECVCEPGVVSFPTPAGTSTGTGESGPCTARYNGEYLCLGDPSIPSELSAPTVKFNALDGGTCEPGTSGTGTWCFYSPFEPAPFNVYPNGVAIKHGDEVCTGPISGQLPMGDCSTPGENRSWGSVKVQYR